VSAPVTIRQFNFPEDYDAVWSLWNSIPQGIQVSRSDTRAEIEKKLQRDPDLFLVGESGGAIVGAVIGAFDGRRGAIYHLAVSNTYRGQGVGSQLLEEVEARLRAKGCIRCRLFVTLENEEAARFYERRGWSLSDDVRPYTKDFD
jgi:ribosomal protein S18 acetylase RimI-like enzyme